jgi:tetratricopeptide (TPR) repeat protein
MHETGFLVSIGDSLTVLAAALADQGAIAEALETAERALRANQIVHRPETLRLRGELRQMVGSNALAENDFRESTALARRMGAKARELRATTSLARMLAKQDKREEARAMLAEIYQWFSDGYDTSDLKDAKALLAELMA